MDRQDFLIDLQRLLVALDQDAVDIDVEAALTEVKRLQGIEAEVSRLWLEAVELDLFIIPDDLAQALNQKTESEES